MKTGSINAIPGPADPAFPSVAPPVASPVTGFLGIIMLDTRFPRPPGDIGHPDTFGSLGVPTHRHVVSGVWPEKVVQTAASLHKGRITPAFVTIARQLERRGARALTTSCGFLVLLQKDLQAAVKIPVITSSLMQLPRLLATERRVGVLTISATRLGSEHLRSAGVPRERVADVVVQGMPSEGEFAGRILRNEATLDLALAAQEVVAAAQALQARAPDLRHLVLECTNMPPYREAIEQVTGLKTWALTDDARLLRPWRPSPPASEVAGEGVA
jgi:hypothetical protein